MIVLASTSPRRKELLSKLCKDFITIAPCFSEKENSFYNPSNLSRALAKFKAYSVCADYASSLILGCDTTVIFDNKVLGKPKNKEDAQRMLKLLSGRKHIVLSSYCILYKGYEISRTVKTIVYFSNLTDENIENYINSGLYEGKAGAYGIQDEKYGLVDHIVGSYYNVMGLPIEQLKKDLQRFGFIRS